MRMLENSKMDTEASTKLTFSDDYAHFGFRLFLNNELLKESISYNKRGKHGCR